MFGFYDSMQQCLRICNNPWTGISSIPPGRRLSHAVSICLDDLVFSILRSPCTLLQLDSSIWLWLRFTYFALLFWHPFLLFSGEWTYYTSSSQIICLYLHPPLTLFSKMAPLLFSLSSSIGSVIFPKSPFIYLIISWTYNFLCNYYWVLRLSYLHDNIEYSYQFKISIIY